MGRRRRLLNVGGLRCVFVTIPVTAGIDLCSPYRHHTPTYGVGAEHSPKAPNDT